ncbi:MAG: hypothetical protein ACN4GB_02175, partial [Candidatus Nanopelagicales bacterium]
FCFGLCVGFCFVLGGGLVGTTRLRGTTRIRGITGQNAKEGSREYSVRNRDFQKSGFTCLGSHAHQFAHVT